MQIDSSTKFRTRRLGVGGVLGKPQVTDFLFSLTEYPGYENQAQYKPLTEQNLPHAWKPEKPLATHLGIWSLVLTLSQTSCKTYSQSTNGLVCFKKTGEWNQRTATKLHKAKIRCHSVEASI